jgi:hypothetical protein
MLRSVRVTGVRRRESSIGGGGTGKTGRRSGTRGAETGDPERDAKADDGVGDGVDLDLRQEKRGNELDCKESDDQLNAMPWLPRRKSMHLRQPEDRSGLQRGWGAAQRFHLTRPPETRRGLPGLFVLGLRAKTRPRDADPRSP